ncbi:hypothetical protein K456DRAFT_1837731, partial [Colletotrichum gloeosporioides 23]
IEGNVDSHFVLGYSRRRKIHIKKPIPRVWTTIVKCISATARVIPPLVIFKGKHVQEQWFPIDLEDNRD